MPGGSDRTTTPFVRAVDWKTLGDAWPTQVVNGVVECDIQNSPFYSTTSATAGFSPAVSQDVVFVTTYCRAVCCFHVITGACLWQGTGMRVLHSVQSSGRTLS
jgi:hypothetical protein